MLTLLQNGVDKGNFSVNIRKEKKETWKITIP